ncbi:MAG: hypothetical protein QXO40_00525 [Candidatus Aenigmatarchaeota archaeon]
MKFLKKLKIIEEKEKNALKQKRSKKLGKTKSHFYKITELTSKIYIFQDNILKAI